MTALNNLVSSITSFFTLSIFLFIATPFFLKSYFTILSENQNIRAQYSSLEKEYIALQTSNESLTKKVESTAWILEENEAKLNEQDRMLNKYGRSDKDQRQTIADLEKEKEALEQKANTQTETIQNASQTIKRLRDQGAIMLIEKNNMLQEKDSMRKVNVLLIQKIDEGCRQENAYAVNNARLENKNAELSNSNTQLTAQKAEAKRQLDAIRNGKITRTSLGIGSALLGMILGLMLVGSLFSSKQSSPNNRIAIH